MYPNEFEMADENSPLISNNSTNRVNHNSATSTGSEFNRDGKEHLKRQSFSSPISDDHNLSSNDGNNNTNDSRNDTSEVPDQDIRIYAKRWYILAIFSILGVLQVQHIIRESIESLLNFRAVNYFSVDYQLYIHL